MTYNTHEDAQNALDTLHETHTFPGMDVAMVLKWVDQDLQKRRKMGPDAGMYGESQLLVIESVMPLQSHHQLKVHIEAPSIAVTALLASTLWNEVPILETLTSVPRSCNEEYGTSIGLMLISWARDGCF